MVDLGAHCFPPATILNGGGATWGLVSPFLVILGPSSFVLGAIVWVSCGVCLGGPALSVAVNSPIRDISCRAGQVGPVNKSLILVLSVCHQVVWVGCTLLSTFVLLWVRPPRFPKFPKTGLVWLLQSDFVQQVGQFVQV